MSLAAANVTKFFEGTCGPTKGLQRPTKRPKGTDEKIWGT